MMLGSFGSSTQEYILSSKPRRVPSMNFTSVLSVTIGLKLVFIFSNSDTSEKGSRLIDVRFKPFLHEPCATLPATSISTLFWIVTSRGLSKGISLKFQGDVQWMGGVT